MPRSHDLGAGGFKDTKLQRNSQEKRQTISMNNLYKYLTHYSEIIPKIQMTKKLQALRTYLQERGANDRRVLTFETLASSQSGYSRRIRKRSTSKRVEWTAVAGDAAVDSGRSTQAAEMATNKGHDDDELWPKAIAAAKKHRGRSRSHTGTPSSWGRRPNLWAPPSNRSSMNVELVIHISSTLHLWLFP